MPCNIGMLLPSKMVAILVLLVLVMSTSRCTVDSGNNNYIATVLKSNFRPYGRDFNGGRPLGRFCNGRLPPDFISEYFGLKPVVPAYLDPAFGIADFASGVCFASAGTGYDNATSRVMIESGAPPMGCLPLERNTNFLGNKECNELYNTVALRFNAKLTRMVQRLNRELHGIKVVNVDPYFKFLDIIQKPAEYGFEEAEMGCCATGMYVMGYTCKEESPFTCDDANNFVFWDAFHPTDKTNFILSRYIVHTYLLKRVSLIVYFITIDLRRMYYICFNIYNYFVVSEFSKYRTVFLCVNVQL